IDSEEGCLSIPGCTAVVKRAERIVVEGIDRKGAPIRLDADGLLSRAIQHEIDHLDGVLILDRLSPIKREFLKKKYMKVLRRN
ncbi:MAG: peptide deformylase, partial [Nitrospirae bacterium]|nr:peptide deformylase [Nitrospirota bacterium]